MRIKKNPGGLKMIKFGTGGWRAVIGDDFICTNVRRVAAGILKLAAEQGKTDRPVIIGYDRRFLSDSAAKWVAEVLAQGGMTVWFLNRSAPTPLVMHTVKNKELYFGIEITASHNPASYNGIKLIVDEGRDAPIETTERLEELIGSTGDVDFCDFDKAVADGKIVYQRNLFNDFIDDILELLDVKALRERGLRVLFDTMHGSGPYPLQVIFHTARCTIDTINLNKDAYFGGQMPAPTEQTLSALRNLVTKGGYDLGIAMDGDGDRLGIIDKSGKYMDANEILTAYTTGSHFNAEEAKDKMADVSDAEFLKMVVSDTAAADEKMKLLVIPGNLNADINLDGKNIKWADLTVYEMNSDLLMKERCLQLTNTLATSNIGNVSFEGFYATRSKKDIKAGFNFEFKDITAEKAIDLMPAMDTIMPLLKSFSGKLNCELAATASLDTNMNILMPTINGVMRMSGNDLTISDSEMFTSLAKKLKFDDRNTGNIQQMTVEGVIQDNVLEVFPFVIKLDRYTLALSGKQNLDMSYRYHASIIRSPLVLKVGVDVYGQDFDHMKFKIGRPKYKNERVPVFTAVIDQTRINLAESIRNIFEKGVDAAVQENSRQEAIREHREEIGYVNAVDQETEELSEEEQKEFEETTENTQDNE